MFLYRCANILDVYLSFLFVCTVSLTLVSDPTSRRFIRWLLFQTFIYIYGFWLPFGIFNLFLRCCNMSLTLDVFRCLLVTYFVALRWNISILFMSVLRWESHTEKAYSSDGLTNDLYACSLTEVETMFTLRRKKPRVFLVLPQILLMWFPNWDPHYW